MVCEDVDIKKIKTIINFWSIKNWIKRQNLEYSKNHIATICLHPKEILKEKLEKRYELSKFIVELLFKENNSISSRNDDTKEEMLVDFSVHELKDSYVRSQNLFKSNISIDDIEACIILSIKNLGKQ